MADKLARESDIGDNQKVRRSEVEKIRRLADIDLVMLISEIHDHGWPSARELLSLMPDPKDWAGYRHEARELLKLARQIREKQRDGADPPTNQEAAAPGRRGPGRRGHRPPLFPIVSVD
jgi:hypothetical protein